MPYRIWLSSFGAAGAHPLPDCRPFDTRKSAEIYADARQRRAIAQDPDTSIRFEIREEDIFDQAAAVVRDCSDDPARMLRAAETVATWYVADPMEARGLIVEQLGNVVWAMIGGQRYTITVLAGP